MFKNKLFLSGLGFGLILGALLLQLMITASPSAGKAAPGTAASRSAALDKNTVSEWADNNQFALVAKKEWEDLNAKARQAATATPSPATPSPSAAPSEATGEITIFIYSGMSSDDVVNYLFEAGIVSDRQALAEKIKEDKLEEKLKRGTFKFNPNEKMDDVLKVIAKRSN